MPFRSYINTLFLISTKEHFQLFWENYMFSFHSQALNFDPCPQMHLKMWYFSWHQCLVFLIVLKILTHEPEAESCPCPPSEGESLSVGEVCRWELALLSPLVTKAKASCWENAGKYSDGHRQVLEEKLTRCQACECLLPCWLFSACYKF